MSSLEQDGDVGILQRGIVCRCKVFFFLILFESNFFENIFALIEERSRFSFLISSLLNTIENLPLIVEKTELIDLQKSFYAIHNRSWLEIYLT